MPNQAQQKQHLSPVRKVKGLLLVTDRSHMLELLGDLAKPLFDRQVLMQNEIPCVQADNQFELVTTKALDKSKYTDGGEPLYFTYRPLACRRQKPRAPPHSGKYDLSQT